MHGFHASGKIVLIVILIGLRIPACAYAFDWAPFFAVEKDAHDRLEWLAMGPLSERSAQGTESSENVILALPRPFYCRFSKDAGRVQGWDFLWPLAFGRSGEGGGYQYALLFFHTQKDSSSQTDAGRERWWLPPVFFYGHADDAGHHLGIFPIAGKVHDIAGYDRISWLLFPLYASNRKSDVKSRSFLWPVFGQASGPKLTKWRVFPLYGVRTTPTKERQFILWPFVHTATDYRPDRGQIGSGFFIFPLAGHYRGKPDPDAPSYRMWTFLWPFFSGYRQSEQFRYHLPWPFYQHARQKTNDGYTTKTYLWPFYGSANRPQRQYWFSLWPVLQSWKRQTESGTAERFWFLPFYWSSKRTEQNQVVARTTHIWPFTGYIQADDQVRFWAPAPWYKATGDGITRNYAPFWRLYTYARNGAKRQHQLLWGLWQYQTGPQELEASLFPVFNYHRSGLEKEWSILKGLLGQQTDTESGKSSLRMLWFLKW